jgi:hypothetical protein
MSADKVKFQLDVKEDTRVKPFYIILALLFAFLVFTIVSTIFDSRSQSEQDAQFIARDWAQAVLQSNDPMKYKLLTESAREKYVVGLQTQDSKKETTYNFEKYDVTQWKKDHDNYIYKFHYFGLQSCAKCQKDVWVHVVRDSDSWKVPDYQFTEDQAEAFIQDLSGEKVYSSTDEEEVDKPLLEKILSNFL